MRKPGPCELTGPVADQPVRPRTPPGVGTPLRADGLPGQRHPSSHNVPDWKKTKRRETEGGSPCARGTRTMKQCSSDARTIGHPTHSPFEFTATGMGGGGKGKALVGPAQSGPALLPAYSENYSGRE